MTASFDKVWEGVVSFSRDSAVTLGQEVEAARLICDGGGLDGVDIQKDDHTLQQMSRS